MQHWALHWHFRTKHEIFGGSGTHMFPKRASGKWTGPLRFLFVRMSTFKNCGQCKSKSANIFVFCRIAATYCVNASLLEIQLIMRPQRISRAIITRNWNSKCHWKTALLYFFKSRSFSIQQNFKMFNLPPKNCNIAVNKADFQHYLWHLHQNRV